MYRIPSKYSTPSNYNTPSSFWHLETYYSKTCFERPLVLTMENDHKSQVATQTKVDLGD